MDYATAQEMRTNYADIRRRLRTPKKREIPVEAVPAEPDPPQVSTETQDAQPTPSEPSNLIYLLATACLLEQAADRGIHQVTIIKRAVSRRWKLPPGEIDSKCRSNQVVLPRQVAMALARRLTVHSFPDIGRRFGNRDHTTVMHAVHKMQPVLDRLAMALPQGATVNEWVDAAYSELME